MARSLGVVLLADVVSSRHDATAASRWLAWLCAGLDEHYGDQRLAPFDYTAGDELQGLLRPDADPLDAVLEARLRPRAGPGGVPDTRWVVALGPVDPGDGPATKRTGEAFVLARELAARAREEGDGLRCRTATDPWDALLDGTAPVLSSMIDGLTDRQRELAHLSIVDRLSQAAIAERLGVARPTVSIGLRRARERDLGRLSGTVRLAWRSGVAAVQAAGAA
jgi:DNA-binding CsgD family transcriptional regulator